MATGNALWDMLMSRQGRGRYKPQWRPPTGPDPVYGTNMGHPNLTIPDTRHYLPGYGPGGKIPAGYGPGEQPGVPLLGPVSNFTGPYTGPMPQGQPVWGGAPLSQTPGGPGSAGGAVSPPMPPQPAGRTPVAQAPPPGTIPINDGNGNVRYWSVVEQRFV